MNLRLCSGPESTAGLLIAIMMIGALIPYEPCQAALHHSSRESARIIESLSDLFDIFGPEKETNEINNKRDSESKSNVINQRSSQRSHLVHENEVQKHNLEQITRGDEASPYLFQLLTDQNSRPKRHKTNENLKISGKLNPGSVESYDDENSLWKTAVNNRQKFRENFPPSKRQVLGKKFRRAPNRLSQTTTTLSRQLFELITDMKRKKVLNTNMLAGTNFSETEPNFELRADFNEGMNDRLHGKVGSETADRKPRSNHGFIFQSEQDNNAKTDRVKQKLEENPRIDDFLFQDNRPTANPNFFPSNFNDEPTISNVCHSNASTLDSDAAGSEERDVQDKSLELKFTENENNSKTTTLKSGYFKERTFLNDRTDEPKLLRYPSREYSNRASSIADIYLSPSVSANSNMVPSKSDKGRIMYGENNRSELSKHQHDDLMKKSNLDSKQKQRAGRYSTESTPLCPAECFKLMKKSEVPFKELKTNSEHNPTNRDEKYLPSDPNGRIRGYPTDRDDKYLTSGPNNRLQEYPSNQEEKYLTSGQNNRVQNYPTNHNEKYLTSDQNDRIRGYPTNRYEKYLTSDSNNRMEVHPTSRDGQYLTPESNDRIQGYSIDRNEKYLASVPNGRIQEYPTNQEGKCLTSGQNYRVRNHPTDHDEKYLTSDSNDRIRDYPTNRNENYLASVPNSRIQFSKLSRMEDDFSKSKTGIASRPTERYFGVGGDSKTFQKMESWPVINRPNTLRFYATYGTTAKGFGGTQDNFQRPGNIRFQQAFKNGATTEMAPTERHPLSTSAKNISLVGGLGNDSARDFHLTSAERDWLTGRSVEFSKNEKTDAESNTFSNSRRTEGTPKRYSYFLTNDLRRKNVAERSRHTERRPCGINTFNERRKLQPYQVDGKNQDWLSSSAFTSENLIEEVGSTAALVTPISDIFLNPKSKFYQIVPRRKQSFEATKTQSKTNWENFEQALGGTEQESAIKDNRPWLDSTTKLSFDPQRDQKMSTESAPDHYFPAFQMNSRHLLNYDPDPLGSHPHETHYIVDPGEEISMIYPKNHKNFFTKTNSSSNTKNQPPQRATVISCEPMTCNDKRLRHIDATQNRFFLNNNLKCQFLRGNLPPATLHDIEEQMRRGNDYSYMKRMDIVKGNSKSIIYKIVLINNTQTTSQRSKIKTHSNSNVQISQTQTSTHSSHPSIDTKSRESTNVKSQVREDDARRKSVLVKIPKYLNLRKLRDRNFALVLNLAQLDANRKICLDLTTPPWISNNFSRTLAPGVVPVYVTLPPGLAPVNNMETPLKLSKIYVQNNFQQLGQPQAYDLCSHCNQYSTRSPYVSYGPLDKVQSFTSTSSYPQKTCSELDVCVILGTQKPIKDQIKETIKAIYPGKQKCVEVCDCVEATQTTARTREFLPSTMCIPRPTLPQSFTPGRSTGFTTVTISTSTVPRTIPYSIPTTRTSTAAFKSTPSTTSYRPPPDLTKASSDRTRELTSFSSRLTMPTTTPSFKTTARTNVTQPFTKPFQDTAQHKSLKKNDEHRSELKHKKETPTHDVRYKLKNKFTRSSNYIQPKKTDQTGRLNFERGLENEVATPDVDCQPKEEKSGILGTANGSVQKFDQIVNFRDTPLMQYQIDTLEESSLNGILKNVKQSEDSTKYDQTLPNYSLSHPPTIESVNTDSQAPTSSSQMNVEELAGHLDTENGTTLRDSMNSTENNFNNFSNSASQRTDGSENERNFTAESSDLKFHANLKVEHTTELVTEQFPPTITYVTQNNMIHTESKPMITSFTFNSTDKRNTESLPKTSTTVIRLITPADTNEQSVKATDSTEKKPQTPSNSNEISIAYTTQELKTDARSSNLPHSQQTKQTAGKEVDITNKTDSNQSGSLPKEERRLYLSMSENLRFSPGGLETSTSKQKEISRITHSTSPAGQTTQSKPAAATYSEALQSSTILSTSDSLLIDREIKCSTAPETQEGTESTMNLLKHSTFQTVEQDKATTERNKVSDTNSNVNDSNFKVNLTTSLQHSNVFLQTRAETSTRTPSTSKLSNRAKSVTGNFSSLAPTNNFERQISNVMEVLDQLLGNLSLVNSHLQASSPPSRVRTIDVPSNNGLTGNTHTSTVLSANGQYPPRNDGQMFILQSSPLEYLGSTSSTVPNIFLSRVDDAVSNTLSNTNSTNSTQNFCPVNLINTELLPEPKRSDIFGSGGPHPSRTCSYRPTMSPSILSQGSSRTDNHEQVVNQTPTLFTSRNKNKVDLQVGNSTSITNFMTPLKNDSPEVFYLATISKILAQPSQEKQIEVITGEQRNDKNMVPPNDILTTQKLSANGMMEVSKIMGKVTTKMPMWEVSAFSAGMGADGPRNPISVPEVDPMQGYFNYSLQIFKSNADKMFRKSVDAIKAGKPAPQVNFMEHVPKIEKFNNILKIQNYYEAISSTTATDTARCSNACPTVDYFSMTKVDGTAMQNNFEPTISTNLPQNPTLKLDVEGSSQGGNPIAMNLMTSARATNNDNENQKTVTTKPMRMAYLQIWKRNQSSSEDVKAKNKKLKAKEAAQKQFLLDVLKNSSLTLKEFQDKVMKLNHDVQCQRQLLLNLQTAQEKKLHKKFLTLSGDQLNRLLDTILKKSQIVTGERLPNQEQMNLLVASSEASTQTISLGDFPQQKSDLLTTARNAQFKNADSTKGMMAPGITETSPTVVKAVKSESSKFPDLSWNLMYKMPNSYNFENDPQKAASLNNQYKTEIEDNKIQHENNIQHNILSSKTICFTVPCYQNYRNDLDSRQNRNIGKNGSKNRVSRVVRKYVEPKRKIRNTSEINEVKYARKNDHYLRVSKESRYEAKAAILTDNPNFVKNGDKKYKPSINAPIQQETDVKNLTILSTAKFNRRPKPKTSTADAKLRKSKKEKPTAGNNDTIFKSGQVFIASNIPQKDRESDIGYGILNANNSSPAQIFLPDYVSNSANKFDPAKQMICRGNGCQQRNGDIARGTSNVFGNCDFCGNVRSDNNCNGQSTRRATMDMNKHETKLYDDLRYANIAIPQSSPPTNFCQQQIFLTKTAFLNPTVLSQYNEDNLLRASSEYVRAELPQTTPNIQDGNSEVVTPGNITANFLSKLYLGQLPVNAVQLQFREPGLSPVKLENVNWASTLENHQSLPLAPRVTSNSNFLFETQDSIRSPQVPMSSSGPQSPFQNIHPSLKAQNDQEIAPSPEPSALLNVKFYDQSPSMPPGVPLSQFESKAIENPPVLNLNIQNLATSIQSIQYYKDPLQTISSGISPETSIPKYFTIPPQTFTGPTSSELVPNVAIEYFAPSQFATNNVPMGNIFSNLPNYSSVPDLLPVPTQLISQSENLKFANQMNVQPPTQFLQLSSVDKSMIPFLANFSTDPISLGAKPLWPPISNQPLTEAQHRNSLNQGFGLMQQQPEQSMTPLNLGIPQHNFERYSPLNSGFPIVSSNSTFPDISSIQSAGQAPQSSSQPFPEISLLNFNRESYPNNGSPTLLENSKLLELPNMQATMQATSFADQLLTGIPSGGLKEVNPSDRDFQPPPQSASISEPSHALIPTNNLPRGNQPNGEFLVMSQTLNSGEMTPQYQGQTAETPSQFRCELPLHHVLRPTQQLLPPVQSASQPLQGIPNYVLQEMPLPREGVSMTHQTAQSFGQSSSLPFLEAQQQQSNNQVLPSHELIVAPQTLEPLDLLRTQQTNQLVQKKPRTFEQSPNRELPGFQPQLLNGQVMPSSETPVAPQTLQPLDLLKVQLQNQSPLESMKTNLEFFQNSSDKQIKPKDEFIVTPALSLLQYAQPSSLSPIENRRQNLEQKPVFTPQFQTAIPQSAVQIEQFFHQFPSLVSIGVLNKDLPLSELIRLSNSQQPDYSTISFVKYAEPSNQLFAGAFNTEATSNTQTPASLSKLEKGQPLMQNLLPMNRPANYLVNQSAINHPLESQQPVNHASAILLPVYHPSASQSPKDHVPGMQYQSPASPPSVNHPPVSQLSVNHPLAILPSLDQPSASQSLKNHAPGIQYQSLASPPPVNHPSMNQISVSHLSAILPSINHPSANQYPTDHVSGMQYQQLTNPPSIINPLLNQVSVEQPSAIPPSLESPTANQATNSHPYGFQAGQQQSAEHPPAIQPTIDHQSANCPPVDHSPVNQQPLNMQPTKNPLPNQAPLNFPHTVDQSPSNIQSVRPLVNQLLRDKQAGDQLPIHQSPANQVLANQSPTSQPINPLSDRFINTQKILQVKESPIPSYMWASELTTMPSIAQSSSALQQLNIGPMCMADVSASSQTSQPLELTAPQLNSLNQQSSSPSASFVTESTLFSQNSPWPQASLQPSELVTPQPRNNQLIQSKNYPNQQQQEISSIPEATSAFGYPFNAQSSQSSGLIMQPPYNNLMTPQFQNYPNMQTSNTPWIVTMTGTTPVERKIPPTPQTHPFCACNFQLCQNQRDSHTPLPLTEMVNTPTNDNDRNFVKNNFWNFNPKNFSAVQNTVSPIQPPTPPQPGPSSMTQLGDSDSQRQRQNLIIKNEQKSSELSSVVPILLELPKHAQARRPTETLNLNVRFLPIQHLNADSKTLKEIPFSQKESGGAIRFQNSWDFKRLAERPKPDKINADFPAYGKSQEIKNRTGESSKLAEKPTVNKHLHTNTADSNSSKTFSSNDTHVSTVTSHKFTENINYVKNLDLRLSEDRKISGTEKYYTRGTISSNIGDDKPNGRILMAPQSKLRGENQNRRESSLSPSSNGNPSLGPRTIHSRPNLGSRQTLDFHEPYTRDHKSTSNKEKSVHLQHGTSTSVQQSKVRIKATVDDLPIFDPDQQPKKFTPRTKNKLKAIFGIVPAEAEISEKADTSVRQNKARITPDATLDDFLIFDSKPEPKNLSAKTISPTKNDSEPNFAKIHGGEELSKFLSAVGKLTSEHLENSDNTTNITVEKNLAADTFWRAFKAVSKENSNFLPNSSEPNSSKDEISMNKGSELDDPNIDKNDIIRKFFTKIKKIKENFITNRNNSLTVYQKMATYLPRYRSHTTSRSDGSKIMTFKYKLGS